MTSQVGSSAFLGFWCLAESKKCHYSSSLVDCCEKRKGRRAGSVWGMRAQLVLTKREMLLVAIAIQACIHVAVVIQTCLFLPLAILLQDRKVFELLR